jgi:hypothetical protein
MMWRSRKIHPDQFSLNLPHEPDTAPDGPESSAFEAAVAARAEADAFQWRFRLITVETIMMTALVGAAGLTLGQPAMVVIRAAVLIGASCFASGILLILLSGALSRSLSRLRGMRPRS